MLKSFYVLMNSKNIEKSLIKFRKISIKKVSQIIIKECIKEKLNYEIIEKNNNEFIVEISSSRKKTLIVFHKALAVTIYDYYKFIRLIQDREIDKGVYITTGVFQQDVYNMAETDRFINRIKLLNGKDFVVKQRWIKRKKHHHISYDKLSFKSLF
ncbi:restriction endonuclease [Clostridium perfringens]|uniref:restriction endonuclease n=1 Tax=Clostridium perfringens TaxID=1502 RepID=UPI000D71A702|nr:restriction endonuclease [Clostridium perfringens]ELU5587538.1 restriction endonuclease [Clostridium perfringens]MBO3323139.1 restriction endonuclease [Clostridium perfringens]MBO3332454.1 restriction endonuclease [Clostridium perfringens]MDC4245089.1 restriction endonuclease [Clostridium perfringens]MDU3845602.1 restriction endonuclease [Clostridium perfringens]